jgi:hypothetical protein
VEQLTLTGTDGPRLTADQQAAWNYLSTRSGGATAEQIGCYLHALRGKHADRQPCTYCHQKGRSLVTSKALKPLVTYRNVDGDRVYQPRNPEDRSAAVSGQTGEIPF